MAKISDDVFKGLIITLQYSGDLKRSFMCEFWFSLYHPLCKKEIYERKYPLPPSGSYDFTVANNEILITMGSFFSQSERRHRFQKESQRIQFNLIFTLSIDKNRKKNRFRICIRLVDETVYSSHVYRWCSCRSCSTCDTRCLSWVTREPASQWCGSRSSRPTRTWRRNPSRRISTLKPWRTMSCSESSTRPPESGRTVGVAYYVHCNYDYNTHNDDDHQTAVIYHRTSIEIDFWIYLWTW